MAERRIGSVACAIIAGQGLRTKLIDDLVLPSCAGFDELLVVGSHHTGKNYRYLHVPNMTSTTNDALVKRDVAALAARADVIVYLADDHVLLPGFADELKGIIQEGIIPWDCLTPSRYADHPEQGRIRIPNGEENLYCAGHCGVFRKAMIASRPWSAQKHHRNWDLISSHEWQAAGYRFISYPKLMILDVEGGEPWK